jgi:hypothetical protein
MKKKRKKNLHQKNKTRNLFVKYQKYVNSLMMMSSIKRSHGKVAIQ